MQENFSSVGRLFFNIIKNSCKKNSCNLLQIIEISLQLRWQAGCSIYNMLIVVMLSYLVVQERLKNFKIRDGINFKQTNYFKTTTFIKKY